MKTISLTYLSHPTNGKLKLSCATLSEIAQGLYSEEVNVSSSFFYEEDATLIYYLLKQLIAKSNNDQLFIIDNIPFDMLRSMQYAYHEAGKPNTLSKYSFLEFKDGELKAFNQTLGIYDDQIHFANLLTIKGPTIMNLVQNSSRV